MIDYSVETMDLQDREYARYMVRMLVRGGQPVSLRTKEKLLELAQVDPFFEHELATEARIRDANEERQREQRRELSRMLEPLRKALS